MTEWNAAAYDRIAGLQQAMAEEVLGRLRLRGSEQVLDVGCGNGTITAELAARVPAGSVVGVDASHEMVAFAGDHFAARAHPNLTFHFGDARQLPFREEFDLVVSFNALHWVHEQDSVLRGIRSALKPGGGARLRMVPSGPRKCLEEVIQDTTREARWASTFGEMRPPFRHWAPDDYAALARGCGFEVETLECGDHSWDFGSREAFRAFARATFVEWTRRLFEPDRADFIDEVLDRYSAVATSASGGEHCFRFYQMDAVLRRPGGD